MPLANYLTCLYDTQDLKSISPGQVTYMSGLLIPQTVHQSMVEGQGSQDVEHKQKFTPCLRDNLPPKILLVLHSFIDVSSG